MPANQSQHLSELASEANSIGGKALAAFGDFNAPQLNWKPGADQWSIAQCFDHLVTSNETYFKIFEKILSGQKKKTVWESFPWLPGFWGRMLINSLDPKTTRKMKAPKIFHPSSSAIDEGIIRRFVDQQDQIIGYMRATEHLDLEKIIISSPVTKVVTYSLMDAYTIIVVHEKRHFLQAIRVAELDAIPIRSG